jgi:hypothetical protein
MAIFYARPIRFQFNEREANLRLPDLPPLSEPLIKGRTGQSGSYRDYRHTQEVTSHFSDSIVI